jgi:hypothetical protein
LTKIEFELRAVHSEYDRLNLAILIELSLGEDAPLMVDREVHSGLLGGPGRSRDQGRPPFFMRFFDWDQLSSRNNQYVLVQINLWPSRPETVGKRALIESTYVRLAKASDA